MFGTLEGLRNCWVSNSRSVKWFNDFASRHDEIIPGEKLPKDHALFGVSKPVDVIELLLQRLEYRVKRALLLRRTHDALRSIAPTTVSPTQDLICEDYPELIWRVGPHEASPALFVFRHVGVCSYDAVRHAKPLATPLSYVVRDNLDGELHHTGMLVLSDTAELTSGAVDEALEALRHIEELVQGRSQRATTLDVLEPAAIVPGPASNADWVALR